MLKIFKYIKTIISNNLSNNFILNFRYVITKGPLFREIIYVTTNVVESFFPTNCL